MWPWETCRLRYYPSTFWYVYSWKTWASFVSYRRACSLLPHSTRQWKTHDDVESCDVSKHATTIQFSTWRESLWHSLPARPWYRYGINRIVGFTSLNSMRCLRTSAGFKIEVLFAKLDSTFFTKLRRYLLRKWVGLTG